MKHFLKKNATFLTHWAWVAVCILPALFFGCKSPQLDPAGVYGSGAIVGAQTVTTNLEPVAVTNAAGALVTNLVVVVSTNEAAASDGLIVYNADQLITSGYDTMDAYVSWETGNHQVLLQWPEVRDSANNIRTNGQRWIGSALALRNAYVASPTSQTQSALASGVAVITAALGQMQQYAGMVATNGVAAPAVALARPASGP